MKKKMKIKAALLTVSDRCSHGERADASGPALRRIIEHQGWAVADAALVPDDIKEIRQVVSRWIDKKGIPVIITTGGTGIGPRDMTPEAMNGIIEKELPGVAEHMREKGKQFTSMAILSRGRVGTRKKSLIINLPGSPAGASQSLKSVLKIIPHVLSMLMGQDHEKEEMRS